MHGDYQIESPENYNLQADLPVELTEQAEVAIGGDGEFDEDEAAWVFDDDDEFDFFDELSDTGSYEGPLE